MHKNIDHHLTLKVINVLDQVLQRDPECSRPEACSVLESIERCSCREAPVLPKPRGKGGKPFCDASFQSSPHSQNCLTAFIFLATIHVAETEYSNALLTCYSPARVNELFFETLVCLPLQVMEFYCESCETAMCLDCTEGEHREHVTVPLRDVVEQHKAALKTQLDAIHLAGGDCDTSDKAFRISSFTSGVWKLKCFGPDVASAIKDHLCCAVLCLTFQIWGFNCDSYSSVGGIRVGLIWILQGVFLQLCLCKFPERTW